MTPFLKGGQTETVCQVDSSRKVPLPRKNYNRRLSLNYTPKNTGGYRGLAQPDSSPGFDGWLKFEAVPESDSIDGSERFYILYWGLKSEKGQQPQHWDYIGAGGQWHQHEIEEFERQFEAARDKRDFVLKRLDNVLDAIATSVVATSGAVGVAA